MKIKKIIAIILATVLIFTNFTISTSASTNENPMDISLHIYTKECPDSFVKYAKNNIGKFVSSTDLIFNSNTIYIGSPFTFSNVDSNVFYFPIVDGTNIAGLFRVFETDNGIEGIYSQFLCDELQKYVSVTSVENPLCIYMEDNKIIAQLNNSSEVLFEYPSDISFDNNTETAVAKTVNSDEQFVTVEVLDNNIQSIDVGIAVADTTSKYINLSITETQSGNQWCSAYAAAAIMRTLKFNTSCTAKSIMSYFYVNPSTSVSLSNSQIITYAKAKGISVIGTSSLSYSKIFSEIDAGRPIWYGMTSSLGNHAVVLRGYDAADGIYSIWNPWYSFCEYFTAGGTYVPTNHTNYKFTFIAAIYNWKK